MPFPNPSTQFQPGESGNKAGRPAGRTVTEQLRALLDRPGIAEAIAAIVFKGIREGDIKFLHLFMDRTEGKASLAQPAADAGPAETIQFYLPDNGRTRPEADPDPHHPA